MSPFPKMASSNPFRRKSTTIPTEFDESRFPALDAFDAAAATPPPQTSFRNGQIPDAPVAEEKGSKPVKQVRILSPPPISPGSSGWSFTAQPPAVDGGPPREDPDPFEAASTDDSDREIVAPTQNSGWVPPNPFNKTLKDVESVEGEQHLKKERRGEAAALKAGNIARRSLDVNAFKRLLMTGDSGSGSGSSGSPTPPRAQQLKFGHQRSATESFSASPVASYGGQRENKRFETGLHETSLISNDISETPSEEADDGSISDSGASLQISREKKPPPPPSSRHGKSIKLELGEDSDAPQRPRSKSPSDVNKPLPPAPVRKSLDESESPFDRESAGKVPEVDMPVISQSTWSSGKKAVPVPPPRRGHARAESRAIPTRTPSTGQNISRSFEDEAPRRTSMDSVRSRSERSRNEAAPAPPPRRTTGSRQSSHILSPIPSTFNEPSSTSSTPQILSDKSPFAPPLPHTTSLAQSTFRETHSGTPKLYAPPPPPVRNPSVRRPASVRSIDSTSRRISAEVKPHNSMAPPPPPPPPRQRGNSRGSIDGKQQPRRTSFDNYSAAPTLNEDDVTQDGVVDGVSAPAVSTSPQSAVVSGKGADILADLDALQREVDALRGKIK